MKRVIFILSTTLLFVSCAKWRDKRDMTTSKDHNQIEGLFDDMFKTVDQISSETQGIKLFDNTCVDNIVIDTNSSPKTIMVDFGQDDCAGNDGRVRKGILYITYTGRYRTEGTVITVNPQNFSIDGYTINGTKTIVNQGLNANSQPTFSVTVEAQITAPNGEWTASWNGTRTRTWTEGYNTPINIWDDVYHITGNGTGVNRNGISYTMNIEEDLVAKVGCAWIVQGVMTLDPEEGATRTVDWGTGECNNGLTVTVGNHTYEVNGGN
jgi:hypothetical protein